MNGGWGICYEIVLRWMPIDLTDDKSTLVQVMAWCRQATSHYLSQCWPRSLLPYGTTRRQRIKRYRLLKFNIRVDKNMIILPRKYHASWWPGEARSQVISRNGINQGSMLCPAWNRLTDFSSHQIHICPRKQGEVWKDYWWDTTCFKEMKIKDANFEW